MYAWLLLQNLQKHLDTALKQLEDVRRHEQELLEERTSAIENECTVSHPRMVATASVHPTVRLHTEHMHVH